MNPERKSRIASLEAERDRLVKEDKDEFRAKAEDVVKTLTAGMTCEELEVVMELLKARYREQHAYEYDDDE